MRGSAIAKEYSEKSSFARHAQSPRSIGQSAFGEGAESPSRRVFDRTGIVNSSRASGSKKSVSASSRKSEADCRDQAGGPRSPERKTRLPLQVRVERAGSKKILGIGSRRHQSASTTCNGGEGPLQKTSTTGRRSLLPTEINLHHDRFLAEVIAPFDHLPAKFAVEPFG